MAREITIYTDGACLGNPGPGGYAAILISGDHRKELCAGFRRTTNNRMELMGAVVGLEALKSRSVVRLVSDSKYVIDGLRQGWAAKWRANNWMRNKKERAENTDLWQRLLDAAEQHDCTFEWVKGHAGHDENERADELSVAAAQSSDLLIDQVFERTGR